MQTGTDAGGAPSPLAPGRRGQLAVLLVKQLSKPLANRIKKVAVRSCCDAMAAVERTGGARAVGSAERVCGGVTEEVACGV